MTNIQESTLKVDEIIQSKIIMWIENTNLGALTSEQKSHKKYETNGNQNKRQSG